MEQRLIYLQLIVIIFKDYPLQNNYTLIAGGADITAKDKAYNNDCYNIIIIINLIIV
jgi:hypothetical protein